MTKFDARRVGSIRRKAVVEALCSPERHLLEKRAYHPTPRADRAPDAVVLIDHGIRSTADRSEERRVGNECVGTCRSRGSPSQSKKQRTYMTAILITHTYYISYYQPISHS